MTDPDPGPDEIDFRVGVILLIAAVATAAAIAGLWQ